MTSELIYQKFVVVDGQEKQVKNVREGPHYVGLSDQPYSKWQAIFNLE